MTTIIPTLRIYDYDKTIEFYVDWLGFKIEWIHKFDDNAPRFMKATLRDISIHLSEHHGDGSPGTHITVLDFEGLRQYHKTLIDKKYKYNRPGLEIPFWNDKQITVTVIDPVGNKITFIETEKP